MEGKAERRMWGWVLAGVIGVGVIYVVWAYVKGLLEGSSNVVLPSDGGGIFDTIFGSWVDKKIQAYDTTGDPLAEYYEEEDAFDAYARCIGQKAAAWSQFQTVNPQAATIALALRAQKPDDEIYKYGGVEVPPFAGCGR